jgi:hypothetical protein
MKKILLLGGMLSAFFFASAQQRLVLYEEFSGENCGPCAAVNPGLWTLLSGGTNPSKIMLIKYQTPIPSGGPIYAQNTVDPGARRSYYGVNSAPNARMDGAMPPGPNAGHPVDLTQAHIDAAAAIASPFNITVTNTVVGTTLNTSVQVNAVAAYTGTNVKLRVALVESLHFATPPGTNGETDFHHVVRKMYSSADGQAIQNTWTAGQTQTYTTTGEIPAYVDRTNDLFVVVWIQNDADKKVAQAARSTNLPLAINDAASAAIAAPGMSGVLTCGVPATIAPKVTIKNTGSAALTTAKIYYRVGGGTGNWLSQDWAGNLAPNATEDVTMTTGDSATVGYLIVDDSVAMPNGQVDVNPANNKSASPVSIVENTNGQALPVTTDFENSPANWVPFGAPANMPLFIFTGNGKGYNGSNKFLMYQCYSVPNGQVGYNVLPYANIPAGAKALDFYVAHAQYNGSGGGDDKLEVVYSTNCGGTWTSVWSQAGAQLATAPATGSSFLPANNSQWAMRSVDMSAVPANAQVGFKATSAYGNNILVDNVTFRTGAPVLGIEELVTGGDVTVYPNPVNDQLNVSLNMVKAAKVSFTVVNLVGQQVGTTLVKDLSLGKNNTTIGTNNLAPGVYFLNIATEKGNTQQKFVKK